MAAAYFFQSRRSRGFGEAEIPHRPCWVFDYDTSGTLAYGLVAAASPSSFPISGRRDMCPIAVISVAASNITRSDRSYDSALRCHLKGAGGGNMQAPRIPEG